MKKFWFLVLLGLPLLTMGAQDIYQFDTPQQTQRFNHLNQQLRCLVCQNENLADSSAPLAADLRWQIYQMIKQGKSDEEVLVYLVARYGDFVLFKPPLNEQTYLLWFAPIAILFLAFAVLFFVLRGKFKHHSSGETL